MAIREVIFRGKRTDNGKWECGDLLSPNEFNAIPHIVYIAYLNEYGDIGEISTPVIPETVGQFTGLTDKNGVRIFEGDILKSTIKIIDCDDEEFSISPYDREDIGIVEWRKDGFMIAHKSGTWARSFYGCENYVIGNIHDNPKILKGGGENG